MNHTVVHSSPNSYFSKAARAYYFIALGSCTISLLIYQPDYFENSRWILVITDLLGLSFIYTSLFLYLTKKISLKLACSIYVYSILVDLAISNWVYFNQQVSFTGNFLFSTFIYCINITVAGFCVSSKHTFIAAGLYIISFGSLLIVSHDDFLYQNAFTLLFLIASFSMAVFGFLNVLEKTHQEDLILKEKMLLKDQALSREQTLRLNMELKCKQKEIMAKTMYLVEYAENNLAFVKKLNTLKTEMRNAEVQKLNAIIHEHQTNHHQKYWKEFELSFLEIHPEFYEKLSQKCTELSPSELKLAALVQLGLSSKQIAHLSSNTHESVDVARSRLRTKLNLSSEANLRTFLSNL